MTTITAHHASLSQPQDSNGKHLNWTAIAIALLTAASISGFARLLPPIQPQATAQASRPVVSAPISQVFASETRAVISLPETTSGFAPVSLVCVGDEVLRDSGNHMAEAAPARTSIEVRLADGGARVHLPDGFDPNSPAGKWYDVKYFSTTAESVNGNAVISFVDKPFFSIDRVNGQMDVRGLGGTFSGECRNA
jgi:hypothetical protein